MQAVQVKACQSQRSISGPPPRALTMSLAERRDQETNIHNITSLDDLEMSLTYRYRSEVLL